MNTHSFFVRLTIMCLLITVSGCGENMKLRSTSSNMTGHLIPAAVPRVEVRVEPAGMVFQTSGGESLTHCQPYLAWRYAGEPNWRQEAARQLQINQKDDDHYELIMKSGDLAVHISLKRIETDTWIFSGSINNNGERAVELARFHYLQGQLPPHYKLLRDWKELISFGQEVPGYRDIKESLWRRCRAKWDRLPDPIHNQANWAVAEDCGALIPSWTQPGWICGAVGPGTAFGEVGYYTQGESPRFFAGILLDNILLEPGRTRPLEHVMIRFGDLQQGLRYWAALCAENMGGATIHPPMVGYCSWYQYFQNIQAEHVLRATDEFSDWPIPPAGRLIQIDDGYQKKLGDWGPNQKFAEYFDSLPTRIASTGSVPGLWVAPILTQQSAPPESEHPDWIQRTSDGEPAIFLSGWEAPIYGDQKEKSHAMDHDHPGVRNMTQKLFEDIVQAGWKYIKIDFVYLLSTARNPYDRSKTRFESLRDYFRLIRTTCGPDIRLNACIGEPGRYALGLVDYTRLGGDVYAEWESVQRDYRGLFLKFCTNGLWWIGDTDVIYMRDDNSKLSFEEKYLQVGSCGLMGSLFLTSDFPSQWPDEAKQAIHEFWNQQGPRIPSDSCIVFDADGRIRAYRVSFDDHRFPQHLVGLYNWSDEPQATGVLLKDIRLNPGIQWELTTNELNQDVRLKDNMLIVEHQQAHSLRIAGLSESFSRKECIP